ncbi:MULTISPECIES: rod shape-determining protein RodA [unclassified Clostridium]|uniref:rod shape-determining protein RodA n=1 Tax=unclassified Clostridium TaxID=2614128 RepID=UPI0002986582|nr:MULTISPECIES: rod shape-determining protein RodA [unclassified Clostridium]EKQ57824.1 MAG: rod shape-determining protein RodA [Clostridium sp. Maddingley MBC34-26]
MKKFLINRRFLRQLDLTMLITSVIISIFGILNIYSVTNSNFGLYYGKLQILWLIIGLAIVYFILVFDYNTLGSYSKLIYWSGIALLLFNDITSKSVKGASSWIRLGNRAIEPGEFVKFGLILILAKKLDDMDGNINNPKNFLIVSFYALIPMFLIVIQPNLGMTLICLFITLGMYFIADLDLRVLTIGFSSVIPLSLIIWFSGILKTYQRQRILVFLNPESYQQNAGFQLMQSITGIGAGGLFGSGFLKGVHSSGGFIPEVHTDFIFAVVGEEWGFLGAIILLTLYGLLIYRMIKIAKESKDIIGRLICIGTASGFLFSIFQNIGMTIGLMPVAGITLPFMSYGGSSILVNFMSLGLVLNVGMRKSKINF